MNTSSLRDWIFNNEELILNKIDVQGELISFEYGEDQCEFIVLEESNKTYIYYIATYWIRSKYNTRKEI